MHERLQDNLQILETGEFQYVEDGQVISNKGIDVSLYQGNIDWAKVAGDGVEYVFIRVGYRGYGKEGRLVLDEKFAQNIAGAKAAGLKVGVYFFGQAITVEEAREEANLVLQQMIME
jgi:GH25 family lysozyme M1 (1,4-beta-N-acetylmuramidase)